MLALTGNSSFAESLVIERKVKYNFWKEKISSREDEKDYNGNSRNKIVSGSDLFESDEEIAEKYADVSISDKSESNLGDELAIDAMRDTERLTRTINNILSNQRNWIVSEIKKENYEAVRVELKPLDVSRYCKALFEKCQKH